RFVRTMILLVLSVYLFLLVVGMRERTWKEWLHWILWAKKLLMKRRSRLVLRILNCWLGIFSGLLRSPRYVPMLDISFRKKRLLSVTIMIQLPARARLNH